MQKNTITLIIIGIVALVIGAGFFLFRDPQTTSIDTLQQSTSSHVLYVEDTPLGHVALYATDLTTAERTTVYEATVNPMHRILMRDLLVNFGDELATDSRPLNDFNAERDEMFTLLESEQAQRDAGLGAGTAWTHNENYPLFALDLEEGSPLLLRILDRQSETITDLPLTERADALASAQLAEGERLEIDRAIPIRMEDDVLSLYGSYTVRANPDPGKDSTFYYRYNISDDELTLITDREKQDTLHEEIDREYRNLPSLRYEEHESESGDTFTVSEKNGTWRSTEFQGELFDWLNDDEGFVYRTEKTIEDPNAMVNGRYTGIEETYILYHISTRTSSVLFSTESKGGIFRNFTTIVEM